MASVAPHGLADRTIAVEVFGHDRDDHPARVEAHLAPCHALRRAVVVQLDRDARRAEGAHLFGSEDALAPPRDHWHLVRAQAGDAAGVVALRLGEDRRRHRAPHAAELAGHRAGMAHGIVANRRRRCVAAGAAEVVTGLGDIYAQLNPDLETRRNRVRRYGTTGEGLTLEEVRRNRGLRAIAEGQLAQLRETIAQQEAEIAAADAAIARPVADQRRQQADTADANRQAAEAADLGFGRQLRPEDPTIADQERAELERQRKVLARRVQAAERLDRILSLADAGNVPSGFTLPGPLPARFARPAGLDGPSAGEAKAAETAAREIEASAAASQDRLADLTLSRVELIDRAERQAIDALRKLGETKGVDAAAVEAAILATQEATAAERHQVRVEGLAREHDALVASLAAGAEARREAAEREADALAEIEGREIDLGIVGEYEAAITAADRWRDATLADLDTVGEGHEKLRDRALAVHARMVESAREASREQAAAGTSWTDGVRKALRDLSDASTDWPKAAEEVTRRAFASMEDSLVEFVTTGKLSFSDLTRAILADLARIAIQQAITIPLAGALFSAFGPSPGGPTTGGGFGNLREAAHEHVHEAAHGGGEAGVFDGGGQPLDLDAQVLGPVAGLQEISEGVAEPRAGAAHRLALRPRRAPVLALDLLQDQRLRLGEPVGLGETLDDLGLLGGERGAGAAQRREPLRRVFKRLGELERRVARRLAERRRHVERGLGDAVEIGVVDLAEGEEQRLQPQDRLVAGRGDALERRRVRLEAGAGERGLAIEIAQAQLDLRDRLRLCLGGADDRADDAHGRAEAEIGGAEAERGADHAAHGAVGPLAAPVDIAEAAVHVPHPGERLLHVGADAEREV